MARLSWLGRVGVGLSIAILSGCSADNTSRPVSATTSAGSSAASHALPSDDHDAVGSSPEIYAAVVARLASEDNHAQNPAIRAIYVLDGAVAGAGQPLASVSDPDHSFDAPIKDRVRDAISTGPRPRFIPHRREVITGTPPGRVIHDGTLLTLGPIQRNGTHVEVPASYWVNGLDARWSTYVLERGPDGWSVVGTTGPVAIS